MKKKLIAAATLLITGNVYAVTSSPFRLNTQADNISLSTSLGWLGGKSEERVYDPASGKKLSQLDWKINNVAILKGDISWDAFSWLTLNARGWTSLASGSSTLDDWDWLKEGQSDPSEHSHHSNTRLNYANEFDVNLKGWLLQDDDYRLGAVVGYQQTRFSWTAFGGSYRYDNGNDVGELPRGERVIGYQQRFSMPYIGLAGQYRVNNLEVNGLLKYSPWVQANDNDEHYARDLTFREKSNNSTFYGASMDVGYYVTPNAKVFTEVSYNHYSEGKGGSQMIDHSDNSYDEQGGDAAGIANKNYSISAGLAYRF